MAAARTMQATCQIFQQCCVHSSTGAASSGAGGSSSSSGTSAAREARAFVPRAYYSRHSQDATAAVHLVQGCSRTRRRELSCSSSSSSCSFVAPSPGQTHYGRLKCRKQKAGNGTPLGGRGSGNNTRAVAETAVEEASQDSRGQSAEEPTGPREWNAATVLRVEDIAPGVRNVVLEVEASREYVALDNAYTLPGQLARVKVPTSATSGGSEGNGSVGGAGETQAPDSTMFNVACASPPFSMEVNRAVLLKLRGDISAGQSKVVQYMMSVKATLELFVEEAKAKGLYDLPVGAEVMVGPFQKTGIDFLPVMFLVRYPTMLIFADDGPGIAAARAIIEAKDVGSLMLNMREDVRLYYAAEQGRTLAYRELFPEWESTGVKVRATVRDVGGEGGEWDGFVGSFGELFDEDDLEYDPESTAAVVCGSRKTIDEVMRVLEEAGISATQVVQWESR